MSKIDMLCVVVMILIVLVHSVNADLRNKQRIEKLEARVTALEKQ